MTSSARGPDGPNVRSLNNRRETARASCISLKGRTAGRSPGSIVGGRPVHVLRIRSLDDSLIRTAGLLDEADHFVERLVREARDAFRPPVASRSRRPPGCPSSSRAPDAPRRTPSPCGRGRASFLAYAATFATSCGLAACGLEGDGGVDADSPEDVAQPSRAGETAEKLREHPAALIGRHLQRRSGGSDPRPGRPPARRSPARWSPRRTSGGTCWAIWP